MGGFNQGAFIIAGTAIAIAGVGLYLWDTRGKNLLEPAATAAPQYNQGFRDSGSWIQGGRRSRRKKSSNSKTKRR